MGFLGIVGWAGALLMTMALSAEYLRRLPITAAAIYLLIGVAVGPACLDLFRIDVAAHSVVLEHVTECAVIISLFMGGLKLRLPLSHQAWIPAYLLAGPIMLATIAGIAVFSHYVLGFSWASSTLLGAILAPTDPVLAGLVTVDDAQDQDRMRYGLSGEAGFNDGAAFPFVVLALSLFEHGTMNGLLGDWALKKLLWAVPAGFALGFVMGRVAGKLAIWLRSRHEDDQSPNDFLALALIALSYVAAETVGAWGFLAAFAAGIGLRSAELSTAKKRPSMGKGSKIDPVQIAPDHPPAEEIIGPNTAGKELADPSKAAGVIIGDIITFGDTVERLLEALMVVVVGIFLVACWDWRALPLALVLFFVIRPLFTMVFLIKTPTTRIQRALIGWFGIRGIGSLYYLAYSLNHGLDENKEALIGLTISVVALSIALHGISSKPVLDFYTRKLSTPTDG